MKVKLNDVSGPVKNKAGRQFWFASAETDWSPDQKDFSPWKTLRWQSIFTDDPPPPSWKTGAEVEIKVRRIDYAKGVAEFEPKA